MWSRPAVGPNPGYQGLCLGQEAKHWTAIITKVQEMCSHMSAPHICMAQCTGTVPLLDFCGSKEGAMVGVYRYSNKYVGSVRGRQFVRYLRNACHGLLHDFGHHIWSVINKCIRVVLDGPCTMIFSDILCTSMIHSLIWRHKGIFIFFSLNVLIQYFKHVTNTFEGKNSLSFFHVN